MNLRIDGKTKKARLVRLFAPITLKGPLTKPAVGIETSKVVAQGGLGLALGSVLTPLAAILPFVDPGLAKDANCSGLMAQGKAEGAPVKGQAAAPLTAHR
jgi:hypothetical protein